MHYVELERASSDHPDRLAVAQNLEANHNALPENLIISSDFFLRISYIRIGEIAHVSRGIDWL